MLEDRRGMVSASLSSAPSFYIVAFFSFFLFCFVCLRDQKLFGG